MPDHVVFGYCHGQFTAAEFTASMLAMAIEGSTPLAGVIAWESGPNISTARNQIVNKFLTTSDAAWLVMVGHGHGVRPGRGGPPDRRR